jgi:arylsulfatase A-like enzyme
MMKLFRWAAWVLGWISVLTSPSLIAQEALPIPEPPFQGTADIDARRSTPAWDPAVTAPQGAPNIVLILVDDVGFSATSAFGGPIETPAFAALAKSGLRYNGFHVNAYCSPTRAALLSGRNAHQIGFGAIAERAAGFPGYNSLWPKSAASIAEVLKDNGYNTAAFGKWHNTPVWQISSAGPFDRWPAGLGFEYFYGFLGAADNQYYPHLYRNTTPVEPATRPEQGYNLTDDITKDAIRWLHDQDAADPDKPFFLYFATGATHEPHQVPKNWIAKYQGKFDAGWDKLREENFARQKQLGVIPANAKLTPRPEGLPAWDSLSAEEKKLVAHEAEVYAAYAAQADYDVGRVLQAVDDEGKKENTVVVWIFGDNGASAEGGPTGRDAIDIAGNPKSVSERLKTIDELGSEAFLNHYAAAWAWALSAPFQGTKVDSSHLGGTTDPLVISWPKRIKDAGGIRSQFGHVNDIAPTLYELAGIKAPATVDGVPQIPLEGTSLVYTFDHPEEPSRHHVQYFATSGNRAIYKDGWWAGDLVRSTWEPSRTPPGTDPQGPQDYDVHPWQLYDLNNDYSQSNNLAEKYPEKLKELEALFDEEAKRNQVYPLLPAAGNIPSGRRAAQNTFVYQDGVDRLNGRMGPNLDGRAYTIDADVDIPAPGTTGVIFSRGGRYGGSSLFVKNSRVVYEVNAFGSRAGQMISSDPLPTGRVHVRVEITPANGGQHANTATDGSRTVLPGTGKLFVNGKQTAEGSFLNLLGTGAGVDIGSNLGSEVSSEYHAPNNFTGEIEQVTIRVR